MEFVDREGVCKDLLNILENKKNKEDGERK